MDDQIVPPKGTPLTLATAMKLAIQEARKGAPFVSPNPRVGCVVLDSQGRLLSTGYHEKYGELHAEANAIKTLSADQLKGAHLIVTLEPCAHQGQQPSCAKTLTKFPIKKVTFGLVDPNPLVAGQGTDILKTAGIDAIEFSKSTEVSSEEKKSLLQELEEVCEIFLKNFRDKKVFVGLKLATSLDGAIALSNGESKWITGAEARKHTHYLRACYDMTLVGSGTVKADNPSLNIRDQDFEKENKVGVLDPHGETLSDFESLNIFKTHQANSIFIFISSSLKNSHVDRLKKLGINIIEVASEKTFAWSEILKSLWEQNIKSVMIEGGSKVASSIVNSRLIDRLHIFQAPLLLGQKTSMGWNKDFDISAMDQRLEFEPIKITHLGQDLYLTTRLKRA